MKDARSENLRNKTESILKNRYQDTESIPKKDFEKLINDVQVYQIELEIQNEELRNVQKELELSRDRLSILYHKAPVGYIVLDEAGMIVDANQTISEMLVKDRDDLIHKPFSQFVVLADRMLFFSRFKVFFNKPDGKIMEIRLIRENNTPLYARLEGRFPDSKTTIKEQQYRQLLVTIADITKRKLAEEKIVQQEAELKGTLYSIAAPVISIDVENRIARMNPAAESITGWIEADATGRPIDEVLQIIEYENRQQVRRTVKRIMHKISGIGFSDQLFLIAKDGRKIPVAISYSPIFDSYGNVGGAILVFNDRTEEHLTKRLTDSRFSLIEYASNHTLDELLTRTLDEVGEIVDSPIGFYHFVESDQKTLSLQQWSTRTLKDYCMAEGKGAHYSIDKAGVWVDCVRYKKTVIHNDYESLPHKKGLPPGHATVIRELVVPVMRDNKVVAILGVGNKSVDYTQKDVEIVSYFADVTMGDHP